MNLSGIDLNLLLVFDAIISEQHVTRAAHKIGMSQPAMSNALNRLRHHLKDELFIRTRDGMQPTPRAMELAIPIRRALQDLEVALGSDDFDPLTANRTFAIGTNDYCISIFIPTLINRLQKDAPGIKLRLVPSTGQTFDLLDAQEIDFGISAFGDIPQKYGSETLIEDTYVIMMRKGHPLSKGEITKKNFVSARHLVVSPRGEAHGFVDDDLAKLNLKREIALTVNSFSSAPGMLANSDLILTAPKRIADKFAPLYSLTTRPALFSGTYEFSSVKLVWHNKIAAHTAYKWFREYLLETKDLI